MLASAAAAAWSTYLDWLGMDGDISEQAPWTSELLLLAMALAGLAWLTLVLGLRWQLRTKAVAALPGLGTVAIAVAVPFSEGELGEDHWPLTMLPVAVEWFALVALAAIWAWQPEVRGRRRVLRLAVALWGTTAFGIFHQMLVYYMIMVGFSERDWEGPPGTGYLTVAVITISAILILIMTLRTPKGGADDERDVAGELVAGLSGAAGHALASSKSTPRGIAGLVGTSRRGRGLSVRVAGQAAGSLGCG
jgi:hypothetical protein